MEGETPQESVMVEELPNLGATNESLIMAEATQEGVEDSQDWVEAHTPKDYLDDL